MPRRLVLLAVASALALGPVACGAGTVPADEVAGAAEDSLQPQVGERPEVTCPDALEAEVGAQTRCTARVRGGTEEYGLTVTVTSADDDGTGFEFRVDREPRG